MPMMGVWRRLCSFALVVEVVGDELKEMVEIMVTTTSFTSNASYSLGFPKFEQAPLSPIFKPTRDHQSSSFSQYSFILYPYSSAGAILIQAPSRPFACSSVITRHSITAHFCHCKKQDISIRSVSTTASLKLLYLQSEIGHLHNTWLSIAHWKVVLGILVLRRSSS